MNARLKGLRKGAFFWNKKKTLQYSNLNRSVLLDPQLSH
jgi:hypothetical protein